MVHGQSMCAILRVKFVDNAQSPILAKFNAEINYVQLFFSHIASKEW